MTTATRLRAAALPALAAVLVSGVLAVQLANGGGRYSPLRPADPCVTRQVNSVSTGIEGLTEQLVLIGLDNAACRLGTSREALTLQLAQSGAPTDAQVNALRSGLLAAVDRLKAQGKLPQSSQLADEAVDDSNLNGFLKAAIRAIPASLIDNALATDDVLRRTISNLDLRSLLANLGNSHDLTTQVNAAVTKAVTDALTARLRTLL
jgi:small-conductance mechanosensitive channel